MYDPTNGETPLDILPSYGSGRGGSQQAMEYYAGQEFQKLFNRNPTQSELAMLSSAYAGDPNIVNSAAGNSAVAQYYSNFANSPENVNKQKQAQLLADAPKYYDEVNQMFKSTLGRDATDAEKSHFGSLRASGNVDAYTIGQFLNALPENVQKQDKAFRDNLSGDLQKQDSQYYSDQILPAIQAAASKSGRSLDSSGVTNSLALAAQQQNRQREGFLSNLTASQYSGSQGLAQDAYRNAYGNYQSMADYGVNRNAQLTDALTNRVNGITDYTIQKQAYDDYLRRYGKRSGNAQGIGSMVGGGIGAFVGSYGGPAGTAAGYEAGSGLGGAAGTYFA